MRSFLLICCLVLFVAAAHSQMIVNDFERAAVDTFFRYTPYYTGLATGAGAPILTDTTFSYHGSKALKVRYTIHSTESWGGYVQLQHLVPQTDSTFLDFSSATALSIWYYIVDAPVRDSLVYLRLKLHESGAQANHWSDETDHEDWYYQKNYFYDASPGWNQLIIPLVERPNPVGAPPDDQGFSLPGWSGVANNQTLDLDRVVGYSIEINTDGIDSTGQTPDKKLSGTIIWDKLQLSGLRYTPLSTFDGAAADTNYTKDLMSWSGGNTGNLVFKDSTANQLEGTSALKVNWRVHNTESWGGYVNFSYNLASGQFYPDMSTNSHLLLAYKNITPSSVAGTVTMRLFLYDWSDGVEERWAHPLQIQLDSVSSGWKVLRIPLEPLGGDPNVLEATGFKIPGWEATKGNSALNLDKIRGFRLEYTSPGPQGSIAEGMMLFDLMIPTGFKETDVTGPAAPSGLIGTAGSFQNLITWTDVPNEVGEKYDVYYSLNPISDVTAPGVEVVRLGIAENEQTVSHVLRAPATDQSVSYYYAIRATDKVGNIGTSAATASAVTNTAKGVPTISPTAPGSFTADGSLAEWSSITPISIKLSQGTGFKAPNTVIDNDADLSVLAYIAVDNQYLYVAFDVEDDVVSTDSTDGQTWMHDAPDLFIGLWDFHGAPHKSFRRGAQPDYQFRFLEHRILEDKTPGFDLRPGSHYSWTRKFPTGYTVEARISLASLAAAAGDSVFKPQVGMRIPIDFSINDDDGAAGRREGILTYSSRNEDQSWSDPSRWTVTWIGNQWFVTGVEELEGVPYSYDLAQNYPNPFNPTTQIEYTLEQAGFVSLKVFDLLGREVARLVNEEQKPGKHVIVLDSKSTARMSTGIYFYRLEAGTFRSVKKMVLVK